MSNRSRSSESACGSHSGLSAARAMHARLSGPETSDIDWLRNARSTTFGLGASIVLRGVGEAARSSLDAAGVLPLVTELR